MAASIPESRDFEVQKITKLGKKKRILKLTLKGLSNFKSADAAQPSSFHNWSHVRGASVEETRVVVRFTEDRGARQFECTDPFELCNAINEYINAFNAHVQERRRQELDVGEMARTAVIEKQLLDNHTDGKVQSEDELLITQVVFRNRPLGLAISSLLDTVQDGSEISYGALITDSKNRNDVVPRSRIMQIDGLDVRTSPYPDILQVLSTSEMPITLTLASVKPITHPTPEEGEMDDIESEASSTSSATRTRLSRKKNTRTRPQSAQYAASAGPNINSPKKRPALNSRRSTGRMPKKRNENRRQSANTTRSTAARPRQVRRMKSHGGELKVNVPRNSSRSRSKTPESATSDDEDAEPGAPRRPSLRRANSDGEVEAQTPRGASGHRREYNVTFDSKPFGLGLGPWAENRGARVKECTNPSKKVIVGSRILAINGARVKDHVYENIMRKLGSVDVPVRIRFLWEGDGSTPESKESDVPTAKVDETAFRLMQHWDGMVYIDEAKQAESERDFDGAINCYQQGVDSLANRLDISNLPTLDLKACRTQLAVWRKHMVTLENKAKTASRLEKRGSSRSGRRRSDPNVQTPTGDDDRGWEPSQKAQKKLGKKRRSLQVQSISVTNQRNGRNAVTPTPQRANRRTTSELPGSKTPDGRRRSAQNSRRNLSRTSTTNRRSSATPGRRTARGQSSQQDDDDDEKKKSGHEKQEDEFRQRLEADIIDDSLSISFRDVQGLVEVKLALYETVILPALRPELFSGLRAPAKGILLFGPPGNGKTMIAKCVASECQATFFSISASSITSKWVGAAERIMRTLFTLARERAPSIIFIDEIDSLLTARGGKNEAESSRRIKTEFLIQFDGVHTATEEDKRVVCIGATNLPGQLDEAVLRRFSKRILVPLPDDKARYGLLRSLMDQQLHNAMKEKDYREVVRLTKGFSCSDLTNLCRDAAMGPIRDLGASIINIDEDNMPPIAVSHFKSSLRSTRASVTQESLALYNTWNAEFGSTLTLDASALPEDMRPHPLPAIS